MDFRGFRPCRVRFLLSRRADLHARDDRGLQAIHFAALESDRETVAFLVERGANVSAAGHGLERPLHWAAGTGHAAGRPKGLDGRGGWVARP